MVPALFTHVLVPLLALIAVGVIQFDRNTPVEKQVTAVGTDLCILAIGATGGVLINSSLMQKLGSEATTLLGIVLVLVNVILAGISVHIGRSQLSDRRQALFNLFLGLFALTMVLGVVVRAYA